MEILYYLLDHIDLVAITPDNITESDLFVMIVQLAAYITPFFLIPAAFKFGMGVFGNLAGRLNDRSRGLFDRQRKYRQGKYSYNAARMSAGQRFNNGLLNAATSRASTRRLGLGRTGRAAYQQKIGAAAIDFGKSAQGQAVQHNDDALAALTYSSEAQASEMLTKSIEEGGFGFSSDRAKDAIAAARAAGGFGRDRQVWAAQQLAATGTGYENLEQVSKTIARVSNGNTAQAAALAGNINATTKGVGRHDLAPGFGQLNSLAQAEMGAGATAEQLHTASVSAARGVDPMTLVRQKPTAVKSLTESLDAHLETQTQRMQNSNLSPDERAAASLEVKKTIGQISQLKAVSNYGPQENQSHIVSLDASTEATVQSAKDYLFKQQNEEEHRWDIDQFSNPRQIDPRLMDQNNRE